MKKIIKSFCLISIIAIITIFSSCSNNKVRNNSVVNDINDITFNGPYPQIVVISQTDDGSFASIEAVEGHVIVIFVKSTPYKRAVKIIKKLKGEILSSRHNSNYFLVEVGIGNENNFLSQIKQYSEVKYAYYNSISYNEDAIRHLTDNFNSEYSNSGTNSINQSVIDNNSGAKYLNQILETLDDEFNNANDLDASHSDYNGYEYERENGSIIGGNNDEIVEPEDEEASSYGSNNVNNIAVSRAKELAIAISNGDVETLKRLLSADFYRDEFPFSDERTREILLEVPASKRERLRNDIINNCSVTTIPNRAGDVITVIFTNNRTKKDFTVQLVDEEGNNDWRVFEFMYYR
ncbi:MAG: hypothetical protein II990_02355 [Muribaculaceae bacterium]|nr:hypothetical protein [Muribaculaceae bacterium]